MIRLLIALLVISLSVYLLVFKQAENVEQKPEVIYQDAVDKSKQVEQQLLDAAKQQQQDIDQLTR